MSGDITEQGVTVYAASFGQRRLWYAQRLEPASPIANVPLAIRLRGNFDLAAWQRAVDVVVDRHDALRTCFADRGGTPEQVVLDTCRVRVEVEEIPESVAADFLDRVATTPFDPTVAPLLRIALARFADEDHLLAISMHHAITDGRSYDVLLRELSDSYAAIRRGAIPDPPELAVQYGDYAEWQQDAVAVGRWADQAEFWRAELADVPLLLELPTDRPRPSVRSSAGETIPFVVAAPTAAGIRDAARRLGGTVHMALMAAFQALLADIAGQDRFVVGTAVSGRGPAAVEDLIGFFVNTIPVKADCSGMPTFPELFGRVREHLLRAYAHQDLPLDHIVDAVRPPRDPARTPLFQAILTYSPHPLAEFRLPDVELGYVPVAPSGGCHSDLDLIVYDDGKQLQGYLIRPAALIDDERACGWVAALLGLLADIAAGSDRALCTGARPTPPVTAREAAPSGTAADGPRTDLQRFVADIWAQVLGANAVGVRDDLFACGGDSLQALRLLSRVETGTGRSIALADFLREPTVAGLAALLGDATNPGAADRPSVPLGPSERIPARASYGQHRLWFMQRLEPDSTTYTVPVAARVRGALDLVALQRAADVIVERHDVLRTRFADTGSIPEQIVEADFRVSLQVEEIPEAAAMDFVDRITGIPFDLTTLPLFRIAVARFGAADHLVVLAMHHAIADGWSIDLLFRELSLCYNAFQAGTVPVLPDISVRYGDYAEWQRAMAEAGHWDGQSSFWRTELADWPLILDLPTDRQRPAIRTAHGRSLHFTIPPATTAGIRAAARRYGGTVHMVLMAAFQAVLAELSGQDRFVVGTAVSGRGPAAVDNVVGFFVNTIPVKVDCSGAPSRPELFDRVRRNLLRAYTNQDLPLERIVDAVRPPRDLGRTPLFQAVLTFATDPCAELRLGATQIESHSVLQDAARTDLTVEIHDTTPALDGVVEFSTDLFDRVTVASFTDRLLEELAQWNR
ncbi:condensation domain-containing protein [Nocardia sp. NBC_00565]|uniref:condensation domain-containing protein n=1 Tax=Nocardia sp. NBC_00565 TaxID=2975993 RepID=UPI002E8193C1|nr:condensation domain-containing protein [Nocardia sp. NBC_00565]WUC04021.1 condensation domain-containing protein [Nocardia sp. NBC_00565]